MGLLGTKKFENTRHDRDTGGSQSIIATNPQVNGGSAADRRLGRTLDGPVNTAIRSREVVSLRFVSPQPKIVGKRGNRFLSTGDT
jgi:hypothetical protein